MNTPAARYLLAIIFLFVGVMLFVPRIPQSLEYHLFADMRTIFNTPNFWNVISNVPFAIVGFIGFMQRSRVSDRELRFAFDIFCVSVVFVAFGSAYYHYTPDNASLVWDRLPMTIAFMSLFSAVLGDSVFERQNRRLLIALVTVGLVSIVYWHITEQMDAGDLRPYALVQFFPMLAIPWILLRCKPRTLSARRLWFTLLFYVLAKLFEHFDQQVFAITAELQSGHAIKHLAAAIATYCVVRAFIAPAGKQRTR